jgi:uncharacterized protein YyaL (SSP411 family)
MALGGINDQLGGGFCRYSVDDRWMIPHFEKMLYDNGPLLALYTDLWQATGKPLFRQTAEQTAEWVVREMQSPQGGYYSTLDADSEGEEGRFYLWTPDQVRQLLDEDEYRHLARYYGLDREANFEGHWHLHNVATVAKLNQAFDSNAEQARSLLQSARQKLFHARASRVRPGRDEKILSSWNALMIKGMARSGRLLDRPDFTESAEQALAFIRRELWRDGRLLATHKDGQSHLDAYLDDYAYLIDALLEMLQARWRTQDLEFALELSAVLLAHFQDREGGGFYFTADDHEKLIHRPKPFGDDSTPSGNGVAALALSRLGHLLGDTSFDAAAEATLKSAWAHIEQIPHAHCTLLEALEEQLYATETIVIRGNAPDMKPWQSRANRHYAPRRLVVAIPNSETELPGLLAARRPEEKGCVVYICEGTRCEAPVREFERFEQRLEKTEIQPPSSSERQFEGKTGSFGRPRD